MKISDNTGSGLKDQRAILQKITTRRMKIAELENEIATLQNQLCNTGPGYALDDGVFTSEHLAPIPLPTAVPEKIRFGADGMTSSFDGGRWF